MFRFCLVLLLVSLLCTCDRARNGGAVEQSGSQTAGQPDDGQVPELANAEKHRYSTEKARRLLLDSDTANEIDDLFAIAYLLADDDPTVELVGISSAQWFHVWSGDSTVYQSQALNEELVALAGRTDLPLPLGADLIMGKPWGDYDARDSPAARFIIEQAHATPEGEKLAVMCIGAATNLASALALDPTIAGRIVAYTLGFRYDFDGRFWNKDEFNIRRDLNAANYLLNHEGLELHVMPISVAVQYTWAREKAFARLKKSATFGDYLQARWADHGGPDAESWTMWDVALVQAFLQPEQAPEIAVLTPPENARRAVWMYTDIDEQAMERDYWERLAR